MFYLKRDLPDQGVYKAFIIASTYYELFNQVFQRCSKNPILTYLEKITVFFFISLAFKSIIKSRGFNIHKMLRPNRHVVFSPKKNFKELQLYQILTLLSEFWHMSRSQHSRQKCVRDFQKKLVLIFICAFVFFQKYAMTGVQKFLKSALIFIVSQIVDPLFLVIKLICLAENFKAIA